MSASGVALSDEERLAKMRLFVQELETRGARAAVIPLVDTSGVTRVKCIPVSNLAAATQTGIGFGALISVQTVDDRLGRSAWLNFDEPSGDLRLIPDPTAGVLFAAHPGWAWIPADQYGQDREVWPACARSFLRRMRDLLLAEGVRFSGAFELEWFLGRQKEPDPLPVHHGPAYGAGTLPYEFALDLMDTLALQDVGVQQFHPEGAPGQYEISVGPGDALATADTAILVRETIRALARRHGYEASFSPMPLAGQPEGNGAHLHLSLWDLDNRNIFADGEGPHGLTPTGEAFLAGILAELPALVAVTCPSFISYLRLRPNQYAGAFKCWGLENREAALRFIVGMIGYRDRLANAEFKAIDPSANPYLAVGALLAAGLSGLKRSLDLPPPTTANPSSLSEEKRKELGAEQLPGSLADAVLRFRQSSVLLEAMGQELFGAVIATREKEVESFSAMTTDEAVRAHTWRY